MNTPPAAPHVICDDCRTAARAELMAGASRFYDLAETFYRRRMLGNARRCRVRRSALAWAAGELARGVRA